jgi:hypothetical protein
MVSAVRSVIQPIAPGLGQLEPLRLRVGDTQDFEDAGRGKYHPAEIIDGKIKPGYFGDNPN